MVTVLQCLAWCLAHITHLITISWKNKHMKIPQESNCAPVYERWDLLCLQDSWWLIPESVCAEVGSVPLGDVLSVGSEGSLTGSAAICSGALLKCYNSFLSLSDYLPCMFHVKWHCSKSNPRKQARDSPSCLLLSQGGLQPSSHPRDVAFMPAVKWVVELNRQLKRKTWISPHSCHFRESLLVTNFSSVC